MPKERLIGAHINISGIGPSGAIEVATQIGANTLQIFTKSNRSFVGGLFSEAQVQAWDAARKAARIGTVFVHAGYLINLASPDSSILQKSIQSLALELELCNQLSIPYLVLHPGSRKTNWLDQACKQVGSAIDQAYERLGKKVSTMILIESMAGDGTKLGTFEDLAAIRTSSSNDQKIGFCIDTAHAWAIGYDLAKGCRALLDQAKEALGLENVRLVHLNDSKYDCGSRHDEHQNWPNGKMGLGGLENILKSELADIPMILETPHPNGDYGLQAAEIRLIKSILKD